MSKVVVSFTHIIKSGEPAFSVLVSRFILGETFPMLVYLSLLPIIRGCGLAALTELNFNMIANVPIVVAINKCDKPASDPERVKVQLASEGLPLKEIGGDVQVVEVSAVTKKGLDKLEEALLLQAKLMDLKARVDGATQAYVVEARLDKGRGPLITTLVKVGTLVCGQHVVVGAEWGKIKAIRDTTGKLTNRATPAMPVEIEWLKGLSMAGDDINVVDSEERARMLNSCRKKILEQDRLRKINEDKLVEPEPSEEEEFTRFTRVELTIIVKGDVQGTVQAVTDSLKTLNGPHVCVCHICDFLIIISIID